MARDTTRACRIKGPEQRVKGADRPILPGDRAVPEHELEGWRSRGGGARGLSEEFRDRAQAWFIVRSLEFSEAIFDGFLILR